MRPRKPLDFVVVQLPPAGHPLLSGSRRDTKTFPFHSSLETSGSRPTGDRLVTRLVRRDHGSLMVQRLAILVAG
jgi:hypothetical protein